MPQTPTWDRTKNEMELLTLWSGRPNAVAWATSDIISSHLTTGRLQNTRHVYTMWIEGISRFFPMDKRINVVLPETTIQTIDRIARPGQRSRFINKAVQHYVTHRSTEALRAQLERTAARDQDLDREIAADWFGVDHETWQQLEKPNKGERPVTQGVVKSTSRRSIRR